MAQTMDNDFSHTIATKDERRRIQSVVVFRVLLIKDLRQEFRTRDMLTSMGLYAILTLIVYGVTVATNATTLDLLPIAAGLFWAMIVFTSLLGLNRTFTFEQQSKALEGLLLAPIERHVIFFAKATANTLFLIAVECICLPVFWFLFLADIELGTAVWAIILPLFLGTVGIAGMGTFLATITTHAQGKDILLAILLIPIIYPLLHACVAASCIALTSSTGLDFMFVTDTILALGYDVIMLIAAWILYGFVIEA